MSARLRRSSGWLPVTIGARGSVNCQFGSPVKDMQRIGIESERNPLPALQHVFTVDFGDQFVIADLEVEQRVGAQQLDHFHFRLEDPALSGFLTRQIDVVRADADKDV